MTGAPFWLGTAFVQDDDGHEALDAYVAAGGRRIDTARAYGESEAVIGRWLRSRDLPDDLVVLTKGGCRMPGDPQGRIRESDIRPEITASREALGLDALDIYLLHYDDPGVPVDEAARLLTAVVAEGLTREVGVSNWDSGRVAALIAALAAIGGPPLTLVSNYWGLAHIAGSGQRWHAITPALRQLAAREGFALSGWSAMGAGFFAHGGGGPFESPENARRARLLAGQAARAGVTPLRLLARWLVTAGPVVPVMGSTRADHVGELAQAAADASLDGAVAALTAALGGAPPDVGDWQD